MQPIQDPNEKSQEELFRMRLDQMLDKRHPLYQLAGSVNWSMFEHEFGCLFVPDIGRPGLPVRLMVGLHYLKHLYDVSDEDVVEMFVENPYWQHFCGFEYFQRTFPCNPTSLVKWRKRVWASVGEFFFSPTTPPISAAPR